MNGKYKFLHTALLSCLIMAALAVAISTTAFAARSGLSTEFMAGFAFFKFAKTEPDFDTWISSTSAYKNATPSERVEIKRQKVPALQARFDSYVVSENPIPIKTRASFVVPKAAAAKKMLEEKGAITIKVELIDQPDNLFPLSLTDMWIAMIPNNLEPLLTLKFSEQEFINFKKQTNHGNSVTGRTEVALHLNMLPVDADTKEPLQINGFDLWMLNVTVTGFEIWDQAEANLVWYMDVPGQRRRNHNSDIYNLYEN